MAQIKEAGHHMLGIQRVRVEPDALRRRKLGPVGKCPVCGEAYPLVHGRRCKACQGESPFVEVCKNTSPERILPPDSEA